MGFIASAVEKIRSAYIGKQMHYCWTKIRMIGGWNLIDSNICNKCGKLVGLNHSESRTEIIAYSYTVDEIKQLH